MTPARACFRMPLAGLGLLLVSVMSAVFVVAPLGARLASAGEEPVLPPGPIRTIAGAPALDGPAGVVPQWPEALTWYAGTVVSADRLGVVRQFDPATGQSRVLVGSGSIAGGSVDGTLAGRFITGRRINGVAVNRFGMVAFLDGELLRRVTPEGTVVTFANAGFRSAADVQERWMSHPEDLLFDSDRTVVVVDAGTSTVRRFDIYTGAMTIVAGNRTAGFSGDGGAATGASLDSPSGLSLGPDGSLYIADSNNHRIRRVAPGGVISTVAGNGAAGQSGDGGAAIQAALGRPVEVSVGADGSVLVVDGEGPLRRIAPDGTIGPVVGSEWAWDALAAPNGQLYVASWRGLSSVSADGVRTQIAPAPDQVELDGLPATSAPFMRNAGMAVSPGGQLYLCLRQHVYRLQTSDSTLRLVSDGCGLEGLISAAGSLAFGPDGSLYAVAPTVVNRIDVSSGAVTRIAGTGASGSSGDGGPALEATFRTLVGVAVDSAGTVFVADRSGAVVRKITPDGMIFRYAGTGDTGDTGDGGPATAAALNMPTVLMVDHLERLHIGVDRGVRRVDPDGTIRYVIGPGSEGSYPAEENIPATARRVQPNGLAIAPNGAIYVSSNCGVLRVEPTTGMITTVAGLKGTATAQDDFSYVYTNGCGYTGDGGPANRALINYPGALAIDPRGTLYFSDNGNMRVRAFDGFNNQRLVFSHLRLGAKVIRFGSSAAVQAGISDGQGANRVGSRYFPGHVLQLQRRSGGATTWSFVRNVTANDIGAVGVLASPSVTTTYRYYYPAQRGYPAMSSSSLVLSVQPTITIAVNTSRAVVGRAVSITGTVAPAHPGISVLLQRRAAGTWRTIATVMTGTASRYAFSFTPRDHSDPVLRVVAPAHLDHALGASPSATLLVT